MATFSLDFTLNFWYDTIGLYSIFLSLHNEEAAI